MSETPNEAPATDAPGATIFVCPACGTRYDEPTTCSNGHEPTETVEYDRATLDAAAAGDETAQAAIADASAAAGIGSTAGVSTASPEAVPLSHDPAPLPTAVAAAGDATAVEPVAAADAPAAADETAADVPAAADAPDGTTEVAAAPAEDIPAPVATEAVPVTEVSVSVNVDGVIYSGTLASSS